MATTNIWSGELVGELGRLWQDGLSTAEIGRRLGISKNAVVGKAHRLNLPSRPSPIRHPPLRMAPRYVPEPDLMPPPAPKVVSMASGKGPGCQWPHGHPGHANFHFCGKQAEQGRPYCSEHVALAYVPPRTREEAAA